MIYFDTLAHAYALAGNASEARRILEELRENSGGCSIASLLIARTYLGLGEIDRALDWLGRGIEERSYWNVFLKVDPVYDPIRGHPRFRELLKRAGFAPAKESITVALKRSF